MATNRPTNIIPVVLPVETVNNQNLSDDVIASLNAIKTGNDIIGEWNDYHQALSDARGGILANPGGIIRQQGLTNAASIIGHPAFYDGAVELNSDNTNIARQSTVFQSYVKESVQQITDFETPINFSRRFVYRAIIDIEDAYVSSVQPPFFNKVIDFGGAVTLETHGDSRDGQSRFRIADVVHAIPRFSLGFNNAPRIYMEIVYVPSNAGYTVTVQYRLFNLNDVSSQTRLTEAELTTIADFDNYINDATEGTTITGTSESRPAVDAKGMFVGSRSFSSTSTKFGPKYFYSVLTADLTASDILPGFRQL